MGVISFSIDDQTKMEIDLMARAERRSRSDIFRDMYEAYKFKKTLAKVQKVGRKQFLALGIETIDQAEEYLE